MNRIFVKYQYEKRLVDLPEMEILRLFFSENIVTNNFRSFFRNRIDPLSNFFVEHIMNLHSFGRIFTISSINTIGYGKFGVGTRRLYAPRTKEDATSLRAMGRIGEWS